MGEYKRKKRIFTQSHKILNYITKISNATVEKPGRYHLHRVTEDNIPRTGTNQHVPPDMIP